MCDKESLNFYKLSSLLLDIGTNVLIQRIDEECRKKSVSFEDFLNQTHNRDTLSHLWQPARCCIAHCNKKGNNKILQDVQWKYLYTGQSVAGHVKRDSSGKVCQYCACTYKANTGINSDSLDTTLASCILVSLCTLTQTERNSIEKLRGLRNSVFAHARQAKISDKEFQQHWKEIENEIISISTVLGPSAISTTKNKVQNLQDIPFVDKDTLQTLIKSVLKEAVEEISEANTSCIQANSTQSKVRRITEAEVNMSQTFYKTRALEAGIEYLDQNGILIFTGICGSGKSRNSLEILRLVKDGKLFQGYKIQHISIENFDSQIDLDENTIVFLEDPLGTTNADTALVQHDRGLFRKIFACIQEGRTKVIMTIRSNILDENKDFLQRHELFNKQNILDLSSGNFALNTMEKSGMIRLYCDMLNIDICESTAENILDNSTDGVNSLQSRMFDTTIRDIVASDPPIGLPLCCKLFFENNQNMALGARFFSQPTRTMLEKIREMVMSEDEIYRRRIIIMIYILMKKGTINLDSVDHNMLNEIAVQLDIPKVTDSQIQRALAYLTGKFVVTDDHSYNKYTFLHASILECVFIECCKGIQSLVPELISFADIKTVCELVRTNSYMPLETEVVVKIPESFNKSLARRFVKEMFQGNFGLIITHSAMSDENFKSTFIDVIKEGRNRDVFDIENSQNYNIFNLACLYDRSELVETFIEENLIYSGMLREGYLTCIRFENERTLKLLLQQMTPEQLREAFLSSCKQGKMVAMINEFAKEDLLEDHYKQGFAHLCARGNVQDVRMFLQYDVDDSFKRGFTEACKAGNVGVIDLLLGRDILTDDDVVSGFVKCCEYGQDEIAKRLFKNFTATQVQQGIIEACNLSSRRTISQLIQSENVVQCDAILQCLLTIVETESTFSHNRQTSLCATGSVPCRPYPLSIKTLSVPIKTPATNNINLFPQIEKGNANTLQDQEGISTSQVKAFLVRSILQCCKDFSDEQIEKLFTKACQKGVTEVVHVISEWRENKLPLTTLRNGLNCSLKSKSIETFKFILSSQTFSYEDLTDIVSVCCEQKEEIIFQVLLDNALIKEEHYPTILELVCKNEWLEALKQIIARNLTDEMLLNTMIYACECGQVKFLEALLKRTQESCTGNIGTLLDTACIHNKTDIIKCIFDTCHNVTFEDFRRIWYVALKRENIEVTKVILQKRQDFPLNEIVKVLLASRENNDLEIPNLILPNRSDIPSSAIFTLSEHACENCDIRLLSTITKSFHVLSKSDKIQLLNMAIEKLDFSMFDTIVRGMSKCEGCEAMSESDLKDISLCLTEQFVFQYRDNILKTFSEIVRDHSESKIVKLLFYDFSVTKEEFENISQLLKNSISARKPSKTVRDILLKHPDLPSKYVTEALHLACGVVGNSATVKVILEHGPKLPTNEIHRSYLIACKRCNKNVVKHLVKHLSDEQILHRLCSFYFRKTFRLSIFNAKPDIIPQYMIQCLDSMDLSSDIEHIIRHTGKKKISTECAKSLLSIAFVIDNSEIPDILAKHSPSFKPFIADKEWLLTCEKKLLKQAMIYALKAVKLKNISKVLQQRQDFSNDDITDVILQATDAYFSYFLRDNIDEFANGLEIILKTRSDIDSDILAHYLDKICSCIGQKDCTPLLRLFIQEKALTTNQIYQSLFILCSSNYNISNIECFLHERRDLTNDQIYRCLCECCSYLDSGKGNAVESFLKQRPDLDLTTQQVYGCFLRHCTSSMRPDLSIISTFLQRPDLTNDQIYRCFCECCSHLDHRDANVVDLYLKQVPDLTTQQFYNCFLNYCTSDMCKDSSIISTFLQRPDLTNDQIYRCFCECCSHLDGGKGNVVESFLKQKPGLTTKQIFNCFLKYCSSHTDEDSSLISTFLQRRPDLPIDQIASVTPNLPIDKQLINDFLEQGGDMTRRGENKDTITYDFSKRSCMVSFIDVRLDDYWKWSRFSDGSQVDCYFKIDNVQNIKKVTLKIKHHKISDSCSIDLLINDNVLLQKYRYIHSFDLNTQLFDIPCRMCVQGLNTLSVVCNDEDGHDDYDLFDITIDIIYQYQ